MHFSHPGGHGGHIYKTFSGEHAPGPPRLMHSDLWHFDAQPLHSQMGARQPMNNMQSGP